MSGIKLIVLPNIKEFGEKVNEHLLVLEKEKGIHDGSQIININLDRFSNREGKATLCDSVRGQKLFILSDVGNYGKESEYISRGRTYIKSPDDHFQDLKRVISSTDGRCDKIYAVTPLLYESRQDKKPKYTDESLDCRDALKELEFHGVNGIITFDAHNPVACENALNNTSFDNLLPTYSILKKFTNEEDYDPNKLLVVAPDAGALERAKDYANTLGVNIGMFHKQRDYSRVVNGKNPVISHAYLGDENAVKGKDIIVVDDMIASGGSILEVCEEMKKRGANRIYLVATFALFTEGDKTIEKFDKAFKDKLFYKLYTTNVTYVPKEVKDKKWYVDVDLSRYLAKIISAIDNGIDTRTISDGTKQLTKKLKESGKFPKQEKE